jgi:hypothetical protein
MSGENTNIDVDKIVKYWIDTSDEDFQTMLSLYDSKSYGWSLFLCTADFTNEWIEKIKILRIWIKQML